MPLSCEPRKPKREPGGEFQFSTRGEIWNPLDTLSRVVWEAGSSDECSSGEKTAAENPRRHRLCRMRRRKAETGVMCPIPLPEGMSSEHRTRWHDKDQEYPSEAALCRVSDYLVSF